MPASRAPLVSVGIPVRNGAATLARAIASIQAQTIDDVEIVVSDNASTDDTVAVAERCAAADRRIRVVRQPQNLGATGNFMEVLKLGRGTNFMFLGHDDWIEPTYLEKCLASLDDAGGVSLAAGIAYYHRGESVRREHRPIKLTSALPAWRMLEYLATVHDNGVFYGVARRAELVRLTLDPVMGSDWLWVARLAFLGRVVTRDDVAIHRDLGGSTRSYASIAAALKLPAWHAAYPRATIAAAAFGDIAWKSRAYAELERPARFALATAALGALGAHTLRDMVGSKLHEFRTRRSAAKREPSP